MEVSTDKGKRTQIIPQAEWVSHGDAKGTVDSAEAELFGHGLHSLTRMILMEQMGTGQKAAAKKRNDRN